MSLLLLAGAQQVAAQEVVFSEDFESGYSGPNKATSPSGSGFAGRFTNDAFGVSVDQLPPHTGVRIQFSLYLIATWDGNHEYYGPDVWSMGIDGGPSLVNTTFSSGFDRAFPYDPDERNTLAGLSLLDRMRVSVRCRHAESAS